MSESLAIIAERYRSKNYTEDQRAVDQDFKDMRSLADAYLSPPDAGPGFDATEFVWKCLGEHPANAPKLVAELRAALGMGSKETT